MGVSVPTRDLLKVAANAVKSFRLCSLVVRASTTALAVTQVKEDGYSVFPSKLDS